MRVSFERVLIVAAFAAVIVLGGTAQAAPVYEWSYKVDANPTVTTVLPDPNNNTASVVLLGGTLTISINTNSNNPGNSSVANLFNATTDVVNTSGVSHVVTVMVTETDFKFPLGAGELTADVGSVTLHKVVTVGPGSGTAASATFSAQSSVDLTNAAFGTAGSATTLYAASGTQTGSGSTFLPDAHLTGVPPQVVVSAPFSMTVANTVTLGKNTSAHIELNANLTSVPEPSTMALAGLGALGLIGYGLRRRKAMGA